MNALPRLLLPLLLALPLAGVDAAHAAPADPATGRWSAADRPDTASMLELSPDGRFRYGLSEGALDEGAEGRWAREGGIVRLFTEPRPVPPRFSVRSMDAAPATIPLSILVTAPNGRGIAGIRFRIDFDGGPPLEYYTQESGWTGEPADRRSPRWIQLYEPVHGFQSDRIPVPAGARTLRFLLEPNDLGTVDFQGAQVTLDGDRLTLRDRRGERHYARVTP